MVGDMGRADGHALLGCCCLSGTEGGPGVRGRHPHRHHCRGHQHGCKAQQGTGRERHHSVDRCLLGCRGGRCHLHAARHLYPASQVSRDVGLVPEDIPLVAVGRHHRHLVPHPLPQVFRERHARQVSLPRSHGHDTGAGERSQGQRPGQAVADSRTGGRTLRLHRGYLRLVE